MNAPNAVSYNAFFPIRFFSNPVSFLTSSISSKATLIANDLAQRDASLESTLFNEVFTHVIELVKTIAIAILCTPILPLVYAMSYVVKSNQGSVVAPLFPQMREAVSGLRIEVWNREHYLVFSKVARSWQRIAETKCRQAKKRDLEFQALFHSAATISRLIAECLESPQKCSYIFDRMYLCKDAENRIQAIALTSNLGVTFTNKKRQKEYLKLALLVTHPRNIRSCINEREHTRVQGAGAALVKKLAKECLATNKAGIYAEVTRVARPFYEKLGFRRILQKSVKMLESSEIPMILSIEAGS